MMRANELADTLGISMRTFYRRLKDGEIEGVETLGGKRYQVAETARPAPAAVRRTPSVPMIVQVTENTRLQARVDGLEQNLELATSLNSTLMGRIEVLEAQAAQTKKRLDALLEWSSLAESRLSRRR